MGNNSSRDSVYNDSHRELHLTKNTGSVYSLTSNTTFRTNRTGMSNASRRTGIHRKYLYEGKGRFLGRYYMRNVGETTLAKVQSHIRRIKGVKSKLKISHEGLHTGYKTSSILQTHVPPSLLPLNKIYQMEIDSKYHDILYCATQHDFNFEVHTYRMRTAADAIQLRTAYKTICNAYMREDVTKGIGNLSMGHSTARSRTYLPHGDDDRVSNWTMASSNATRRNHIRSVSDPDEPQIIYGRRIDDSMDKNATITKHNQPELEQELYTLSRDVRVIKDLITSQQSNGYDIRAASSASNYPASVTTNDSGFTGEKVAAGRGVVSAIGGGGGSDIRSGTLTTAGIVHNSLQHTYNQQQMQQQQMQHQQLMLQQQQQRSGWKSESALTHAAVHQSPQQPSPPSYNTLGNQFVSTGNSMQRFRYSDDMAIQNHHQIQPAEIRTTIPHTPNEPHYDGDFNNNQHTYTQRTIGHQSPPPSNSNGLYNGGTMQGSSSYVQHSRTVERNPGADFSLVYPRARTLSSSRYNQY